MVARLTFPKRLNAALHYNEKKVQSGVAVCIGANGFLSDVSKLNFGQKRAGLERNFPLNQRATTKTLHVSLNFSPAERFDNDKLARIANDYMERIGFGAQPYVIYRHHDAGHPHVHVVTTTIKDDGSRINTHNLGKNGSEKARKELERIYNLVQAATSPKKKPAMPAPVHVEKLCYGKTETKRAVASVVSYVFANYRYASLPQFNAALRQFNVVADAGKEGGRIHRTGGLVYRVLNEDGTKVGVPIKASSLFFRPTLLALQEKFRRNDKATEEAKARLKRILDTALPDCRTVLDLREQLAKQNVFLLTRESTTGFPYGITFVDNATKTVFNGSDLGKRYSAATIVKERNDEAEHSTHRLPVVNDAGRATKNTTREAGLSQLVETLVKPDEPVNATVDELLGKKRKKRRRKNDPSR